MVIYNPIWVPSQPCLCWGLEERPNPWDFCTVSCCLASNLPNLQQVPHSVTPQQLQLGCDPSLEWSLSSGWQIHPKGTNFISTQARTKERAADARAFPAATSTWAALSDSKELQGIFTKEWITGRVQQDLMWEVLTSTRNHLALK